MKTTELKNAEEFSDMFTTFKADKILKEGLEGRFPNHHLPGTSESYEHERNLVTARQDMLPPTLALLRQMRKKLIG